MADEKRSWTKEGWQHYKQEIKEENAGDGDAGVVGPAAKRKKVTLPTGPLAKVSTKAAGSPGAVSADNAGGASSGSGGDTTVPAGFGVAC